MTLSQTPDFPESFQPLASAMAKALSELRDRRDVNWTYLSQQRIFKQKEQKQEVIFLQVKNSH